MPLRWAASFALAAAAAGCASAPLERAGSLKSYDRLSDANGLVTRAQIRADKKDLLAAKSVMIVPTTFPSRGEGGLNAKEKGLVANAISRELCLRLGERFRIVSDQADADLIVQATVTHATPTNAVASGASRAVAVAKTVALPGVPVPVPRLPIGLGSLAVEAEARDFAGFQKAAMVWARAADSISSQPRISDDGDAYDLASEFGADFSKLIATGDSPFGGLPSLPSLQSVPMRFGAAPKYVACAQFGRFPGVTGFVGQGLGLPPTWTDKGAGDGASQSPVPSDKDPQQMVSQ